MRSSHISLAIGLLTLASTSSAFAATLLLPGTRSVISSSSTSSSATSSAASMSPVKKITIQQPKNFPLPAYCAAIAATLAKGEKTTSNDATNKQRIDQTVDLLRKANAICGAMNLGTSSKSSTSSSVSTCVPDGYMGVKGTCDGKSWSTGGVCMPKSYWEGQVKQSCTATMANVSYEQPCVTKENVCAKTSSSTSSSSSVCTTSGFMGAKLLCAGKPISSGGVCKPKVYWETWAKQTCSDAYAGFEVQVPCALECAK